LVMPGMDGHTLATRLRTILPDLRVLFMAGYSEEFLIGHSPLETDPRVLRKPFSRSDLLERVRRALSNS